MHTNQEPSTENREQQDLHASAADLVSRLSIGYIASAALQVAVSLEIPDRLAGGPRTVADLARDAGVQEDALYRVLRMLASVGIFEEHASKTFALTLPATMLQSQPGSMRPLALWMTDPFHLRTYAEAMHSVQTGQPAADKVLGMPVFEYFARDAELSTRFNDAMTGFSALVIPGVLKAYDFSGIRQLVDVAGGHGEVLTSILRAYPEMQGVLFDLDHVVAGAVPRIEALGLADRCPTVGGDFFVSVPAGGDAYIMKHIIHDWDDDRALVILGHIRTALGGRRDGRVLLLEWVLAPGNEPDMGKFIDLEMLLMPGGRERTAEEFADLFTRAGFELTRIVPTESPLSVIEARLR